MSGRLVIVTSTVDRRSFDRIDRTATVIGLMGSSLERADEALFDRVLARRATLLVAGTGAWRDYGLAVGLWSDYFAVGEANVFDLNVLAGARATPSPLTPLPGGRGEVCGAVASGIVRRIGRAALPLLLSESSVIGAREAVALGLADALLPEGKDPSDWVREWVGPRNTAALHSGASLVRRRGGDMMERAEFARLFATGEPQRGLARFLEKRPLDFSEDLIVEMI